MSKKKTILTSIGIGGTLAVLGLAMCGISQIPEVGTSQTPIVESFNNNVKLAATTYATSYKTPVTTSNGIKVIPEISSSEMTASSFNYLGVNYQVSNGVLVASALTSPASTTDIYLFTSAKNPSGTINTDYSALDLSGYTGLKRVILIGNTICSKVTTLKSIPQDFDLYIGGTLDISEDMAASLCTEIYVCTPYNSSMQNLYDQTNLTKSKVETVYYHSGNIAYTLYTNVPNNAAGVKIKTGTVFSPTFAFETFYPYEGFKMNDHYYGCKSFAVTKGITKDVLTEDDFYYQIKSKDSHLGTLVLNEKTDDCDELGYSSCNKLVLTKLHQDLSSNFMNVSINELILTQTSSRLSINSLMKTKVLRLAPTSTPALVTFFGSNQNYNANIEKILIPEEYKVQYEPIANSSFSDKVEFYKLSEYKVPTENTVLAADGNEYSVENKEYTPTELYAASRSYWNDFNTLDVNQALDTQLIEAKVLTNSTIYQLRDVDQIITYQNADMKALIEAIKERLVMKNGISTTEEVTIEVDETHYNTDGYVTVTATFPDSTKDTKDYMVPKFLGKGNYAYLVQGDDVFIISNTATINLDEVMKPYVNDWLETKDFTTAPSTVADGTTGAVVFGTLQANDKESNIYGYVTETDFIDEDYIETNGYIVNEIDKIYCPTTLDAKFFINQMSEELIYQYGMPTDGIKFVVAYNKNDNTSDYHFTISHKFTDEFRYDGTVNVHITDSKTKIGFVVLKNGTLVALYNHDDLTPTEVETAISNFIKTELNIEEPNIVLASNINLNNTGMHSANTYGDENKLCIVSSGVKLDYTSTTTPIDDSSLKAGYVAMDNVVISSDYEMMDALHAMGKYLLLKDGKKVEDYLVESSYTDDKITFKYFVANKEVLTHTVSYKIVESDTPFIYGYASDFNQGFILTDKQKDTPNYDISTFMQNVFKLASKTTMTPFTTEQTVDFTKVGTETLTGTFLQGNGQYYSYSYEVKVMDMDYEIRHTNNKVEGEPEISAEDKVQTWYEDFKEKLESNKALKALTIALGSILGLGIVWLLYKFIRKIIKWLK